MNAEQREGLGRFVPINWIKQGGEAIRRRERLVGQLVEKGNLPDKGWDETTIEWFIQELSLMDSNNFLNNVGGGEREGRVFSSLVRRRNLGMAHGIGRSGDVVATQPKAAGSSVIAKLCQSMVLDLIRRVLNMRSIKGVIVLPTATGLTLTLVLLALRRKLPAEAKYVVWPRMDQKTCLKSIVSAGYTPVIVENLIKGDAVQADVEGIRRAIEALPPNSVAAVLTTTSCFAPRVPDDVEAIAKICQEHNVAHVINNAYGLQCNKCVHWVEAACKNGRVDAIVQSTDKNFMVPVGGAVVSSPDASFLNLISQTYPGRASMSPILDLFITLLEMGKEGYERLRKERIDLSLGPFREMLVRVAQKNGQRLLISQRNTISFAISLENTDDADQKDRSDVDERDVTAFGSMLFTRGISGARVVKRGHKEKVAGIEFTGYGSSSSHYPCSYFCVACAIGSKPEDIPLLEDRLNETFAAWNRREASNQKASQASVKASDTIDEIQQSEKADGKPSGVEVNGEEETANRQSTDELLVHSVFT